MDVLTTEQRQRCMSSIRGKNSTSEILVRRLVYSLGYRYRLHFKGLPGRPDLVFPGQRKVIFVHGCFWHRHQCKKGQSLPAKNREFWQKKLSDNVERDRRNYEALHQIGWQTLVVWECEIKNVKRLREQLIRYLENPLPNP